jgi:tripartite-type tricarboxylate transporter receptor subunit TctC
MDSSTSRGGPCLAEKSDRPTADAGTKLSRRTTMLLLAAAWTIPARIGQAQAAWPVSVTRFVVPFSAGGALDVLARIIADRLTRELGATFLIESRPGAGGAIGVQTVVRAPPDGSTLLFTSSSVAILPALNPNLGFDPVHDLLPVSVVCDLPPVLLVRTDSRFANLRELIAGHVRHPDA